MLSYRRRPWTLLALLLGVLAVFAQHEAAPAEPSMSADSGLVVSLRGAVHGTACPTHLSTAPVCLPRGHSWHRGSSRRQQRDPIGSLLVAQSAGSIPAVEPLIGERGVWGTRVVAPPHVSGSLAIVPRAPPALN